jgi:ParB family chromosome partitioning protein
MLSPKGFRVDHHWEVLFMEKRRLGRGLDALLGNLDDEAAAQISNPDHVPIETIEQNPFQPRKDFDQEELGALRKSIEAHGILQPLVVRPVAGRFQLIAGERRFRAAQAAGFKEVPVRVVDFNDQQVLEAALVENIQRADLNPIEKAQGFVDYLQRFNMTHEQLASRLGLDRSTVSNLVNLLELPIEVQDAVRLEQISVGHAKVLKGVGDATRQISLCKEIIARGHSVRLVENIIREEKEQIRESGTRRPQVRKTNHVQSLEDELRKKLATAVEIRLKDKHRGHFILKFENNDDFERLLEVLRGRSRRNYDRD